MFDSSKLTDNEKEILADFLVRRKLFDKYINDNKLAKFTCPGCGYPTLNVRGGYEICDVCNWEDDYQDDNEADEVWGGPNADLSLTENRIAIGKTLQQIAENSEGSIITEPIEVLATIKFFADKKKSISDKLTGTETRDHLIWTEWTQVDSDLQKALIKKNKY
jgi:cysteine-rich CPCC protein